MSSIAQEFLSRFSHQYFGGLWPETAVFYDLETSGFDRTRDLILEWGHAIVSAGEVIDHNSIVLNWYATDVIPADWLDVRLDRLGAIMRGQGKPWRLTPEVVKAEGIVPKEALEWIYLFLTKAQAGNMILVSHNGTGFDNEMLISAFEQDLQKDFTFNPNCLLDTSCIEKAMQLSETSVKAFPQPGESLDDYFSRIRNWRAKGIKHNLDQHVMEKYHLAELYELDRSTVHTAGTDVLTLTCLMKEYSKLIKQDGAPNAASASLPVTGTRPGCPDPVKQRPVVRGPVAPLPGLQPTPRTASSFLQIPLRGQRNR